ncbi:MAG: glycoside-pentoside-hexuronide (GPH):cation symporter [Streptococcaceae bacterium]|jgi:melibiose permease/lactose/raffinose/galactose permease|nr:glycoside-pentoside-hexuronide (GPH):cation symporter [Streptococcaceae bacterium]
MTEYKRNRYTFGIGTIGRDMVYTLISMYLIFYFTDVADLTSRDLTWITSIIVGWRVMDAVIDPFIGVIIDNTKSRWGKHKPWIFLGAATSGILTVLIFFDSGLRGTAYIATFATIYSLWSVAYSLNDIAFWSYVPVLTKDQKERENIGSKARIFALIGTFSVVAGVVPITQMLGEMFGSMKQGYFAFAVIIVAIMWLGQLVTLLGVKEPKDRIIDVSHTSPKDFFRAIFKNDQLLYISISMGLFMIGYTTTTSFGLFYFQYVFGNVEMYMIFAIILGISQIVSLILFPIVGKRLKRSTIYLFSTIFVVAGYLVFYFAPVGTMMFVGIGGILIFVGQASIQLLSLMFLADTVEYGHWKLGKRNESVTFSLQPFIYQLGGAAASGITGTVVIMTGLNYMRDGQLLSGGNLTIFKMAMFIFPGLCILIGYLVYYFKFTIDEEKYAQIMKDLEERENA